MPDAMIVCKDTATTTIYTYCLALPLHGALPSSRAEARGLRPRDRRHGRRLGTGATRRTITALAALARSALAAGRAALAVVTLGASAAFTATEIGRAHV